MLAQLHTVPRCFLCTLSHGPHPRSTPARLRLQPAAKMHLLYSLPSLVQLLRRLQSPPSLLRPPPPQA